MDHAGKGNTNDQIKIKSINKHFNCITLTAFCDNNLASFNEDSLRLCCGGRSGEGGPLSTLESVLQTSLSTVLCALLTILKHN